MNAFRGVLYAIGILAVLIGAALTVYQVWRILG